MSRDDCLHMIGAGLIGCKIKSHKWINPPNETAHGALLQNITKMLFQIRFKL